MAQVRYVNYYGKRVSYEWYLILTAADADGVNFTLNSGNRTMGEQWYFYNNQPPVAAYPSENAPHIWVGRWWHALDVNADGGQARLAAWLRARGINVQFTVRGEPWHMQPVGNVPSSEWVIRTFSNPFADLKEDELQWVKRINQERAKATKDNKWTRRGRGKVTYYEGRIRLRIRQLKNVNRPDAKQKKRLKLLRNVIARRELRIP